MSSEANKDRLRWAQRFSLRTMHEATLEALLRAQNYAVLQLLSERNSLLRERYFDSDLSCFSGLSVFSASSEGVAWRPKDRILRHRLHYTTRPRCAAAVLYRSIRWHSPLPVWSAARWSSSRRSKNKFRCQPDINIKCAQGLLREMVDVSTQTEDADTTLTEIEPPILEQNVCIRKRKRGD